MSDRCYSVVFTLAELTLSNVSEALIDPFLFLNIIIMFIYI